SLALSCDRQGDREHLARRERRQDADLLQRGAGLEETRRLDRQGREFQRAVERTAEQERRFVRAAGAKRRGGKAGRRARRRDSSGLVNFQAILNCSRGVARSPRHKKIGPANAGPKVVWGLNRTRNSTGPADRAGGLGGLRNPASYRPGL